MELMMTRPFNGLKEMETHDRTPTAKPFAAMTVAAVKIAPAFDQSVPVVFGAALIAFEQQCGHVLGHVVIHAGND
jgi:hypothetical protein